MNISPAAQYGIMKMAENVRKWVVEQRLKELKAQQSSKPPVPSPTVQRAATAQQ